MQREKWNTTTPTPTVQGETEYQWDADWAVAPEPQLGKVKQISEEGED